MAQANKPAMVARVLITRPEPSASLTAAKLVDLGFSPVSMPLSRTIALEFNIKNQSFDALAVTSVNAFRHIADERLESLKMLPLFAVGEGTARAAKIAGFQQVIEGGGDAVRLVATIAGHLPEGAQILYLAGRVRQPIFEERVLQAGLQMKVCDVYDVEAIDYSANEIRAVFSEGPFVAVLLYSAVAATFLIETMRKSEMQFDAKTKVLCISDRVAQALPAQWRAQALVADHPDENGIFRLFSKL